MTDKHWEDLKKIVRGEVLNPLPVGFVIDSPWLPNWYGIDIIDYLSNDEHWFNANKMAIETFPDIMFLPGFWSEVGMCSEPSAFGARTSFPRNEFPHVHRSIESVEDISRLIKPNPETDGFAPFLLNRLVLNQSKIRDMGHDIRFSVSRGPLNIASYLMGTTEFLTSMMLNPDETHKLLGVITDYLVDWHDLQRATFSSIEGMFILDDIIGFVGELEFSEFVYPYLEQIFAADVSVKFLHNDAQCGISLKYLPKLGVNLFNMGYDVPLSELKEKTDNQVVMLGNIPPRDVLAIGSKEEIVAATSKMMDDLNDHSRVIFSCGGGMPPDVSTENIRTFCDTVYSFGGNK